MPIRFRCAYCNQLLGIARRKAGTIVACPTCAGQVVVPGPEVADEKPTNKGDAPAFEGNEFEDLFDDAPSAIGGGNHAGGTTAGTAAPPQTSAPPVGAWGTHADDDYDVEPIGAPAGVAVSGPVPVRPPVGIFLSPAKATILTVLVIIFLAVAFGAGLLVGRMITP
jgi:hypothetical protein